MMTAIQKKNGEQVRMILRTIQWKSLLLLSETGGKVGESGMSEFTLVAYTEQEAEVCRKYSNMQELVRCKNCKFGYCLNPSCDEKEKIYECIKYPIANLRITHESDWFCADGVKRE